MIRVNRSLTFPIFLAMSLCLYGQTSGGGSGGGTGGGVTQILPGANVSLSPSAGTGVVTINSTSQPSSQYIAPQAISGCGVEYVSGLTYTVGACTYSINGVTYSSPLSSITLPAADPTNPRLDVIFVDTTQVVQSLQGTPAVTPQQPVVDPSTQLQLTFVLVPSGSSTPGNTTTVAIYKENTEWTGSTGGTNASRVNLASTNNPYLGTVDTEFGNGGTVTTTTYAQYLDPAAGTVNMSNYNALVFYIRNKASWPSQRSVTIQWFSGANPTGTAVVLSNGAFGFNATSNTTGYQQISIPVSNFGIPGVAVTNVRFTVTGTGAALTGFYLDQISLQGGNGSVVLPTTLMNFKGTWSSTASYNPNDTVTSGGVGYVALAQNTNVAVTTSATWAPLAPVSSLYLNWTFNSGVAATDASPRFLASHTGTIANCYALTTASDGATALTFNIFDNGSTIFSGGAQTIAAGTAAGTLTTLGSLGTTAITNNDKISINITSGTSSWIFTVTCK